MCEAPSGQSFHTGQIYAARYPITPLFASKLVNFTAYFRHLCIIEKRHPLLSFLFATVVDIGLLTVSETLRGQHSDARPTNRPTDRYLQWLRACHSTLPFSRNSSEHFGQKFHLGVSLVQNFVTKNFVWPWGICFTQFRVLNCNFFCSLGRFEGAKKPPRGSQLPNFQRGFQVGPWTLLTRNFSLTCRKLWPVAVSKNCKQ